MKVAVLIVNWNAGTLLQRCLQSLAAQRRPADRIVVVDNASTDESLAIAAPLLDGVELIRLDRNAGFASANNVAARAAGDADALALLNPDAFPEPDWLAALVDAAERFPEFVAFASQLRLDAAPDRLDGAGDSYHVSGRAWRNGHNAPVATWPAGEHEVFAPCAAAAMYRRAMFEEIGGFDESYFCYFEDVDLGFRLRLLGYRTLYVPASVVRHVSSALSGYRSDFAVYHGERNSVWTFFKNMPGPLLWIYLPQHLALNLASLFFYPFRGQGRAVWRAKWHALRGLRGALAQRRKQQRSRRADWRSLRGAMVRGPAAPYLSRYGLPPMTIADFMSIMFPTIFALGVADLGTLTKKGSAFLVMAVAGGAFCPPVMGVIADHSTMATGFIIPLLCFAFIFWYAVWGTGKTVGIKQVSMNYH
jgi:GT2 family glycosyltransferase